MEINENDELEDIKFSKDGKILAISTNNSIQLLSIDSGDEISLSIEFAKLRSSYFFTKISFIDNDTILIGATIKRNKSSSNKNNQNKNNNEKGISLIVYSISTKKVIKIKQISKTILKITNLDISRNSKLIALTGSDFSISIISTTTLLILEYFKGIHDSSPITSINFNPSGTLLASSSISEKVHIIKIPKGQYEKNNLKIVFGFFSIILILTVSVVLGIGLKQEFITVDGDFDMDKAIVVSHEIWDQVYSYGFELSSFIKETINNIQQKTDLDTDLDTVVDSYNTAMSSSIEATQTTTTVLGLEDRDLTSEVMESTVISVESIEPLYDIDDAHTVIEERSITSETIEAESIIITTVETTKETGLPTQLITSVISEAQTTIVPVEESSTVSEEQFTILPIEEASEINFLPLSDVEISSTVSEEKFTILPIEEASEINLLPLNDVEESSIVSEAQATILPIIETSIVSEKQVTIISIKGTSIVEEQVTILPIKETSMVGEQVTILPIKETPIVLEEQATILPIKESSLVSEEQVTILPIKETLSVSEELFTILPIAEASQINLLPLNEVEQPVTVSKEQVSVKETSTVSDEETLSGSEEQFKVPIEEASEINLLPLSERESLITSSSILPLNSAFNSDNDSIEETSKTSSFESPNTTSIIESTSTSTIESGGSSSSTELIDNEISNFNTPISTNVPSKPGSVFQSVSASETGIGKVEIADKALSEFYPIEEEIEEENENFFSILPIGAVSGINLNIPMSSPLPNINIGMETLEIHEERFFSALPIEEDNDRSEEHTDVSTKQ